VTYDQYFIVASQGMALYVDKVNGIVIMNAYYKYYASWDIGFNFHQGNM
jgi:hypothetical protein